MQIIKTHKAFGGHVHYLQHQSTSTKTLMTLALFMPKNTPKQALIFLSGLTCTHENFITKSGVLAKLAQNDMMLVCPDTSPRGLDLPLEHDDYDFGSGASFYINATMPFYESHYKMYDYINEELYDWLAKTHDMNGKISLAGHSMGGHGALTIGLKNPDKYHTISAFSPITHPSKCQWGKKALSGYLGDNQNLWQQYDACELIKSGHKHHRPLLISQGSEDEFLTTQLLSVDFINICQAHEQDLTFHYEKGYDHSYYFVSSFIKEHVDYHKLAS
jgi:S-formylglutathione hydrolase